MSNFIRCKLSTSLNKIYFGNVHLNINLILLRMISSMQYLDLEVDPYFRKHYLSFGKVFFQYQMELQTVPMFYSCQSTYSLLSLSSLFYQLSFALCGAASKHIFVTHKVLVI